MTKTETSAVLTIIVLLGLALCAAIFGIINVETQARCASIEAWDIGGEPVDRDDAQFAVDNCEFAHDSSRPYVGDLFATPEEVRAYREQ